MPNLRSSKLKLAIIYLLLIAPIQTILIIVGNNKDFFGDYYFWLDIPLRVMLFGLPILWYLKIDKQRLIIKKPTKSELVSGASTGLLFAVIIIAVYYFFIRGNLSFDTSNYSYFSKESFIIFGFFISFINAFSEEFNYRFMIFEKLKDLELKKYLPTIFTGLIFSVHHVFLIVPLAGVYFGFLALIVLTLVSSIWSYFYQKHGSLYSPYISHFLADVALFIIGFDILFLS